MSTWWCVPSARPVEEVKPICKMYRERGYNIALWRDNVEDFDAFRKLGDYVEYDVYPGYARAVNGLATAALKIDEFCDWIVTGGDDTLPDPNHTAEEIEAECSKHFSNWLPDPTMPEYHGGTIAHYPHLFQSGKTFGVMQPTGDRFAGGSIDRIAGSPWLGREWCLRANGGRGPFWPEFTHMFGDLALKKTAEKLGVYWMRSDLIQLHRHFTRESDALDANAARTQVPPHLVKWNTREHWDEMLAIYKRLEAEDFVSCMPLRPL